MFTKHTRLSVPALPWRATAVVAVLQGWLAEGLIAAVQV